MIRRPEEFDSDFNLDTDVVVVGAGPGGGAAAYVLASAGRKVVVLELGGHFSPKDFTKDGIDALTNLYQDGGQRFTLGNAFFVTMFGKGVGGGSLVNSAISFKPPDKVVKFWADQGNLKDFSPESLKPFVEKVQKKINIEILDVSKLGRNNTVFKEGLEKLGFKGGVVPRNTLGCVACGRCFYGCPSGAKQSVDKNFISKAMGAGTDVYTYARVSRIDINEKTNQFESLMAVIYDPKTLKTKCRLTVNAKHLVLAGGAVGTPSLLMKNKICNSSGQVGQNFRCHPSTSVTGIFDEPIMGYRSVVQGYYSDEFFDKDILLETYWAPAGMFGLTIPGMGKGPVEVMKNYKNFAGCGAMIRDESSGSLSFEGEKVQIKYVLNERDLKLLTEGMFRSAEVLLAAGAKTIYADNPLKSKFESLTELRNFFDQNKNLGPDIVREGNHGLGTCRMGEDPRKSVVNSFGRSHDIKNLWIFDVSTFPGALGVNPQVTIMTLALRGAEYLDGNFH